MGTNWEHDKEPSGTWWEHIGNIIIKELHINKGNFKHNWNIIKNHGELCGNSLRTARLENFHFTVFHFLTGRKFQKFG